MEIVFLSNCQKVPRKMSLFMRDTHDYVDYYKTCWLSFPPGSLCLSFGVFSWVWVGGGREGLKNSRNI